MNNKLKKSKTNWRQTGEAPDYRFSLANERTYLAWIRTSLTLLAAAIGLDQLTPELATQEVRTILSAFLCACSGLLAIIAYRRWATNETLMREKKELKYTSFIKIISTVVVFLTFAVILVIIL